MTTPQTDPEASLVEAVKGLERKVDNLTRAFSRVAGKIEDTLDAEPPKENGLPYAEQAVAKFKTQSKGEG